MTFCIMNFYLCGSSSKVHVFVICVTLEDDGDAQDALILPLKCCSILDVFLQIISKLTMLALTRDFEMRIYLAFKFFVNEMLQHAHAIKGEITNTCFYCTSQFGSEK